MKLISKILEHEVIGRLFVGAALIVSTVLAPVPRSPLLPPPSPTWNDCFAKKEEDFLKLRDLPTEKIQDR